MYLLYNNKMSVRVVKVGAYELSLWKANASTSLICISQIICKQQWLRMNALAISFS